MDSTYQRLAERILRRWSEKSADTSTPSREPRLLIALAGPPGSGKTTIANHVVRLVNQSGKGGGKKPRALCISADGFHLPLAALRSLPNADEAIARRGAPWTFDAVAAVALVRRLRDQRSDGVPALLVPTFDHAIKDPVPGGLAVGLDVDVVLLEGNYLLCDEEPWRAIVDLGLVDERWLVRVDRGTALRRVAARHVEAGIEATMEAAEARARGNDVLNGEFVMDKSEGRYDLLIDSVEY